MKKDVFLKNGFTILEVLIAMGIFASIITMAVFMFTGGSENQKRISELHLLQREGIFLMEKMAKELRMAEDKNLIQLPSKPWEITFTNYEGVSTVYCLSDSNGSNCKPSGGPIFESLARNGVVINSTDVAIEDIKFYFADDLSNIQPIITITMKIKKKHKPQTAGLILQNSVALRVYN